MMLHPVQPSWHLSPQHWWSLHDQILLSSQNSMKQRWRLSFQCCAHQVVSQQVIRSARAAAELDGSRTGRNYLGMCVVVKVCVLLSLHV